MTILEKFDAAEKRFVTSLVGSEESYHDPRLLPLETIVARVHTEILAVFGAVLTLPVGGVAALVKIIYTLGREVVRGALTLVQLVERSFEAYQDIKARF